MKFFFVLLFVGLLSCVKSDLCTTAGVQACFDTSINLDIITMAPGTLNSGGSYELVRFTDSSTVHSITIACDNAAGGVCVWDAANSKGVSYVGGVESSMFTISFIGIIIKRGFIDNDGGGLFLRAATCSLTYVSFLACSASEGGAIYVDPWMFSILSLFGCTFEGNDGGVADDISFISGGGQDEVYVMPCLGGTSSSQGSELDTNGIAFTTFSYTCTPCPTGQFSLPGEPSRAYSAFY